MAEVFLVDVFSDRPGDGNRAGVVPDAAGLDEAAMQRLAASLGCPDTAFCWTEAGRRRIRWFTPTCEINLCGHATIAAAHVLGAPGEVVFGYTGGTLTVRPETIGGQTIYWLSRPAPRLEEVEHLPTGLVEALGSPRLDWELPSARTPEGDLLLPLLTPAAVDDVRPDAVALGDVCRAAGVRGVATLAAPGEAGYEVRARFFAPAAGIPEDPATGSVHGAIAVYLYEMDLLECHPEELRALSRQGAPGGRQGTLWLRLRIDETSGDPHTAEVGGTAVTVSPAPA